MANVICLVHFKILSFLQNFLPYMITYLQLTNTLSVKKVLNPRKLCNVSSSQNRYWENAKNPAVNVVTNSCLCLPNNELRTLHGANISTLKTCFPAKIQGNEVSAVKATWVCFVGTQRNEHPHRIGWVGLDNYVMEIKCMFYWALYKSSDCSENI